MNTISLKSYKQYKNKQAGFTIIEVVLVLAIAGLIFLMVFIALPALQRSQRDMQRKQMMDKYRDAIERYKSNNKGHNYWDPFESYGIKIGNFNNIYSYFGKDSSGNTELVDPSGLSYYIMINNRPDDYSSTLNPGGTVGFSPSWDSKYINEYQRILVYVSLRRKCGTNGGLELQPGDRRYAIQIGLENGGAYCIDG